MKKFYLLYFAALCAAAIVSCSKENITENQSNKEPVSGAQAILNPVELTFEANADSKISIDASGTASWEEGDQVKIICFNANGESWTSDPITVVGGKISATVESADTYYAVYPASASIALAKVSYVDNLTVTIPTEQDGKFKNACYYAAKTSSTDKCFNFKAVSGIIKFQAATDYVRADISTVENAKGTQALAGDATCTFNEDGTVNVAAPSGKTPIISVTLEALDAYYVAVPGNATNEASFRFKKDGEDADYEPGVYFNNRITYEPAKIMNFGNVTSRIVTDVYVSPDGTGNGLSAETPAAAADLNEACLGNEEVKYTAVKGLFNYGGVWNCFRMHGLTIHFAAGEYTNAFEVKGNNSSFLLTLEGTSGAILKGGLKVSATRVEDPSKGQTATVTTVKNLTFTAATGLTIATGLCNLEGCTFTGCTTRAAAIGGSSATDVNLNVNFKNCLFSANTVASKGAVTVPDGAAGGIVGFHNCRFENNEATGATTSTGGNGSAIYVGTGKTAIFLNKCTFIGNTCKASANAYVIGTNNANSRFAMNCCTVNAGTPTAYSNGAALTLKGQSVIANSTVWTSGDFGKWGLVALGCATSTEKANGAAIINSVVRQACKAATTYPAVYLHTNYYQNLNYCLHSGADLTVVSGKHTVDNSAKVSAFAGASAKKKVVDGIEAYYYTWTYSTTIGESGFTKPSKTTVENAIKAVGESASGEADGLGKLFLTWLNTVDATALTKDLIGTDRPEAGICPGSVEQN